MIIGIQLVGVLFALGMIYITFIHYKKKQFTTNTFVFWTIIWLGALVASVIPSLFYGVMFSLGIERTVDFLTLIGFALILAIVFYLFISVKKTEKRVEELVRTTALQKRTNKKRTK